MSDFTFLKNPISKKWIVSAPRRAKRPDIANGSEPVCPFCPGKQAREEELYRIGGVKGDDHWEVLILPNKFPFTPHHELVLNTPDHNTSFVDFPVEHIQRLLTVYRHRYNEYSHSGQVVIFHNHGEKAGESIPHSHTQIVVVPQQVFLDVPELKSGLEESMAAVNKELYSPLLTPHFMVFCPPTSRWPDEVWIAPKIRGRTFGEASDDELADMAYVLSHLITIYNLRYNKDFPFNFYIYPDGNWYLRLIPRKKTIGGFEASTGVFVNTQNPKETLDFIKEHFHTPDVQKIMKEHQAEYHPTV